MSIMETAEAFFEACDTGAVWEACAPFCHADATFACQATALSEIATVEAYAGWMQGLIAGLFPDGRYEVHAFSADAARGVATVFATFLGTQTGDPGTGAPTGKAIATDYVYAMTFEDGRIRNLVKVWNDVHALTEAGLA